MVQFIKKLWRFENPTRVDWICYFILFLLLHIPAIINFYDNDGSNNAYLHFSQSLLNGQLTLPDMQSYDDMIAYKGSYYLPYPPFPSVLLSPLVAIFGQQYVNTVFVVLLMSCLNLYLLYRLLVKLHTAKEYIPWLVIAFFFGTGYWFALFTSHHVYSFAHITSCTLQLLLINELLGKKRWWLAGIYIGCSFLTRQFTILYILFALGYMYHLYRMNKESVKLVHLISLLAGSGFFVLLYFAYNFFRFGDPLDPGYAYIMYSGVLRDRVNMHGVFSFRYVLFNLYSFFIKGFNIEFKGNGLLNIKDMDLWGTSLLSASPFLIASVKAKWDKPVRNAAWLTIATIIMGALFYHNNGYQQVNAMRFSLDFLPLLFVLTALGARYIPGWLLKGLIIYAISLNVLGFLIHFFYQ